MSLNKKLRDTLLNNVSMEDNFYEKLISMGDAGDFTSSKYNTMTNYVIKKKNNLLQVGYNQLIKILK